MKIIRWLYQFRELSRTHHSAVFEEKAHWIIPVFFFAMAFLPPSLTFQTDRFLFGIVLGLAECVFAAYTAVYSTYTADHARGELLVERWLFFWRWRKSYAAATIQRIEIINTQKGSGLRIRFHSGRKKTLTHSISDDYSAHQAAAAAFNQFLYTPHSHPVEK